MEEFALFMDDSGSPKPKVEDSTPHFAMGGVIVKRQDGALIAELVNQFKVNWSIPYDTPLHGARIRAQKGSFAWLGKLTDRERDRFHQELTNMVIQCPVVVHACVISRSGYRQRYLEHYGDNTWEMMKTAFSILIERAVKFVARRDGKLMVYHEQMGRREDRLLRQYFRELKEQGHPFNPSNAAKYAPLSQTELASKLAGLESDSKKRPELQLADLCLYPVSRAKEQSENRAYRAMQEANLLIDCLLPKEQIESEGIKYFCF